jgi:hypothetical protein
MASSHRLAAIFALLPVVLPAAGCSWLGLGEQPAEVSLAEQRRDYVPGVSPIYCYSTLGRPDCYSEPQSGPPNRLIGSIE